MSLTIDQQFAYLTKGCVDVVRPSELRSKLERFGKTGKPLTVKVGFDPTAPDLHLGHTVLLRKMKHFQDLGHRVIFVIGDFTGLIGDPSGRSKTRPPLSREQIAENAETYKSQVFKILDPDKTIVEFNSRWLSPLGAEGLIRLAARYNVAQMLERREFRQRFQASDPIAVHEFLYPLVQAYDSVFLEADVELGGTDQLFNLNVGRDLMPSYGLEAQVLMTVPLLEGLRGVEKMSKSLDNYVGVTESPDDMFGKLMSISDELMWRYWLLLTDDSQAQIDDRRAKVDRGEYHPLEAKLNLATRIVNDFYGEGAGEEARVRWENRHSTSKMERMHLDLGAPFEVLAPATGITLERILTATGLASSSSDAGRKIRQGAVSTGDANAKYADELSRETIERRRLGANTSLTLKVGRRAVRVNLKSEGEDQ